MKTGGSWRSEENRKCPSAVFGKAVHGELSIAARTSHASLLCNWTSNLYPDTLGQLHICQSPPWSTPLPIGNGRPNIVNHLISNNLHHTARVGWGHNLCLLSCSRYCHLSTMFPSTCKDTWTVFTLCHYILSNILQRPVL